MRRSIIIVFVIYRHLGLRIPRCSEEGSALLSSVLDPLEVLRHVQASADAWRIEVLLIKETSPRGMVLNITPIRIDCG